MTRDDVLTLILMAGLVVVGLLYRPPQTPCQATCRQAGYILGEPLRENPQECFCEGAYPSPRPIRRMPVQKELTP